MSRRPPILTHAATLADSTRWRILHLLERHELTVSELTCVLQLPQSTVSRHLKLLAGDGWVQGRKDGTSNFYQVPDNGMDEGARRLWDLIREETAESSTAVQDLHRLEGVLGQRRTRSQEFFSLSAHRWDELRDELFGEGLDRQALLGLIDPEVTIGDLGCGTGRVSRLLAPIVRRVVAVDESGPMLAAARERLGELDNVEVRRGRLEELPLQDASLDAAVLILALHHLPEPVRALTEAERVLAPGGRLLVVDMLPHDREEYRQQMGHLWLGFSAEQLNRLLIAAGLRRIAFWPLPPAPAAKGPALFAAVARRPRADSSDHPDDADLPSRRGST